MACSGSTLADCLRKALQEDVTLKYYYVSTPPETCAALYFPPPGTRPTKTYCEYHFMLVSSCPSSKAELSEVALFAIELHIYNTNDLTTIFVSKADSTGCIGSLGLRKGSYSVIQTIVTAFLSWTVRNRHRPDRKLVLSLFARAQGAYIFPGSDENSQKHILSDLELIKWWCKILDPIAREYTLYKNKNEARANEKLPDEIMSKAYLLVPGIDQRRTSNLFPASVGRDEESEQRWEPNHPLYQITSYPKAAPRSIVPRFPDDPKSRFVDELDLEISDSCANKTRIISVASRRGAGHWNSVKTLQQFWELMAFRQECSAGKLVGFMWVLFMRGLIDVNSNTKIETPSKLLTNKPRQRLRSRGASWKNRVAVALQRTGPIESRSPRLKPAMTVTESPKEAAGRDRTQGSRWSLRVAGREYKRVQDIMQRLDFANLNVANSSTQKWIHETSFLAGLGGMDWGKTIRGAGCGSDPQRQEKHIGECPTTAPLNNVSLQRKRKISECEISREYDAIQRHVEITKPVKEGAKEIASGNASAVNIHAFGRCEAIELDSGLIRKKPKQNRTH